MKTKLFLIARFLVLAVVFSLISYYSAPTIKKETPKAQAAGANDYFNSLLTNPNLDSAYSLRTQAQIDQYRFGRGNYPPTVDYDPAVDAAKFQWYYNDASAENIRLPINLDRPASGTNKLLIITDHMWDSSWFTECNMFNGIFPQMGSCGWKWMQITSNSGDVGGHQRIWFEPQMRFIGADYDPFNVSAQPILSYFSAREYLGPVAPTTNDGTSLCGINYGGDTLAPIQNCFKAYPNTWTRSWVELSMEAGTNYTTINWWMADENQDPVPILSNAKQYSYVPHAELWFEYNTSSENRLGGPMRAWGRNVVILRNLADATPLLQKPLDTGNPPAYVPPADSTAPTNVAITSPANNATVSGYLTMNATATDNAMHSIEYRINGSYLGAAFLRDPYEFTWDTTKKPNGTYTLTAVARDYSGNITTSSVVTITTNNAVVTPPPPPPGTPPPPPPPPPVAPPPPPGTIRYVQSATANAGSAASTQLTLNNVAAGNLIVIGAVQTDSFIPSTFSATDNRGDSFVVAKNINSVYGRQATILYAKNVTGGSTTITLNISNAGGGTQYVAMEVSGADTTNPLDTTSSFEDPSAVTAHPCAAAGQIDTVSNVFVFCNGVVRGASGGVIRAGGFTSLSANGNFDPVWQYVESAAAMTDESATFTTGELTTASSVIASFKASSSSNQVPIGSFDEIRTSDGVVRGWSLDPDTKSASNQIKIYIDGNSSTGTLLTTQATDVLRSDVNTSQNATGNHGFEYTIPTQYRNGVSHSIYVYGVDTSNSSVTTLLTGSPKSFTLSTSTPIVGDINLDHIVNSIDYSILNSKWFTSDPTADLNHDGLVNAIDYSMLNANWFKTW